MKTEPATNEVLAREPGAPDGNPVEERVLEAFRGALANPNFSSADAFFASGGTSLMAAKIILALRDEFGVTAPLDLFARQETAAALTLFLRNVARSQAPEASGRADGNSGRKANVSMTF